MQQGVPCVPQATQTLFEQMAFVPLQAFAAVPLPQQGPPSSPHLAQMPEVHLVPGAVHTEPVLEAQHGWPGPPQLPQAPLLQMPLPRLMQAPPTAMQMSETQHPPPLQPLPSQQGVPGSPQAGTVAPPAPARGDPPTPPLL